jgi:hypothetical protein
MDPENEFIDLTIDHMPGSDGEFEFNGELFDSDDDYNIDDDSEYDSDDDYNIDDGEDDSEYDGEYDSEDDIDDNSDDDSDDDDSDDDSDDGDSDDGDSEDDNDFIRQTCGAHGGINYDGLPCGSTYLHNNGRCQYHH